MYADRYLLTNIIKYAFYNEFININDTSFFFKFIMKMYIFISDVLPPLKSLQVPIFAIHV